MGYFATELKVEPASAFDGQEWRLLDKLIFVSDVAGRIVVPAGFVTNFASVPRIPLVYELCGNTSAKAATVHDYLYTTHAVPRDVADAVLREASAATDVPAWRRVVMWAGVRAFGWRNWGTAATDASPAHEKAAHAPDAQAFDPETYARP
jgi:hypothetical protein